ARLVLRLTAREGLPGERGPADTRQACTGPQSGQPVPGEEACHTDAQGLPGGGDDVAKGGGAGGQRPVSQDCPRLVQETAGPGPGRQLDAAVAVVVLRREAHAVSSSCMRESLPLSAYHWGRLRRGPQEVSSHWSRRPEASAPPSLPLLGAAHRWRSAANRESPIMPYASKGGNRHACSENCSERHQVGTVASACQCGA